MPNWPDPTTENAAQTNAPANAHPPEGAIAALERVNNALIRYPRFKELHEEIRLCQELSLETGEPQSIALEGGTGTGKTTLAKAYAQQFPRRETPYGTIIPVLYVEMPSPATVKSVAAAMLREMGDPGASKGTLWSMNERVIHFIKNVCAVQLVILDDFQHLYDSESDRVLGKVSDWLKTLIKETGVPFLVVGIDGKVRLILEANPQLSRLFAAQEMLAPLAWHPGEPQNEFVRFVEYAEKAVGFSLAEEVSRLDMLARLHYASGGGVVGNLMNLLRYAGRLALKHKQAKLNLSLLSLAFTKRMQNHVATLGYGLNPFEAPKDTVFTALPEKPKIAPIGLKGGRRSAVPTINLSDVLSAS